VRAAIRNAGLEFPIDRITVTLAWEVLDRLTQ
jgi:predicted ATPase with chaperone activity